MFMPNPVVSVVIPLFNKEDYIGATLHSIYKQTYNEIELIVIDDSSTDSSLTIVQNYLKEFGGRFKRIVIRSRENTGQSGARDDGITESLGDYLALIDADDLWHADKIRLQVEFLERNKSIDLVLCNYFMLFKSPIATKAIRLKPVEKKLRSWLLTTGYGGALESTGMMRSSTLKALGGFDREIQMCSGLDLAFKLNINGKIGCIDRYLCAYRVLQEGWHSNKQDLLSSYLRLFRNVTLYGSYEKVAKINLSIHFAIWNLRNNSTFKNFLTLTLKAFRHPILLPKYILKTIHRVIIAQLRGLIRRKEASVFRILAGL